MSSQIRLKLIIPLVFVVSVLFLIIYSDTVYRKRNIYDLEQQLYQTGLTYDNEIKSQLDKFYSIAELLAISFSKNISDDDFVTFGPNLLRKIMLGHSRVIYSSLYIKSTQEKDTLNLLNLDDSLYFNEISYTRAKSGNLLESNDAETYSVLMKAEIDKVISKEQTKILSPLLKQIDNENHLVVPVISSIYTGKSFAGYLVLYVSVDWTIPPINAINGYEAYVSSGTKKMVAIKDKNVFLLEDIGKLCFECNDLLTERGELYNSSINNSFLVLCLPMDMDYGLGKWDICLRSQIKPLEDSVGNRLLLWVVGLMVLITGVIIIRYLLVRNDKPLSDLQLLIDNIIQGKGDLAKSDNTKANSQILKIRNSLLLIGNSIKEVALTNKTVASGDYSKKIKLAEFKNELITSSNSLYQQLETVTKKIDSLDSEYKQLKKFTDGLEKISSVLKLYHQDIHELTEKVIHQMVDLMSVAMGAVFLIKKVGEEIWLEQEISYAYHETKYHKRNFKLGESLIGACAAEKRMVHLKKIPEDYLKIISGLGEGAPKSILILPLVFEDAILGVIELGSLGEFDDQLINFAQNAADAVASTLSLAENNIRNTELLEKTRLQTKELEEHDRKMKEALAELKDIQTKTARSEAAVRAKLEAMNNTLMMVEYTTEGILLDANYKFLNTMNYTLDEIKGNNVIELLKEEDREELLKVMNTVKNGNFYEAVMRRHTKLGQEKWFLASYTPVFNDEGIVQNILFIGIDITRMRNNEEQLKSQIVQMSSELEKFKKKDE